MIQIQKNRFLKIFLCFVLCFAVTLTIIVKPLEVHAIVGVDDAIAFTIATIALSLGLSVATNHPAWGEAAIDIYENYISPAGQAALDRVSKEFATFGASYLQLVDWEVQAWSDITTGIINYVRDAALNSSMVAPTVSSSGFIGWTSDSLFSFQIDHNLDVGETVNVNLGKSVFSISRFSKDYVQATYPEILVSPSLTEPVRVLSLTCNTSGLSFMMAYHKYRDSSDVRGDTFRSVNFSGNFVSEDGLKINSSNNGSYYLFRNSMSNWLIGFYDSGDFYSINELNGKYVIQSPYTDAILYNMHFDTYNALVAWFLDECGLKATFPNNVISDGDVYNPSSDAPITGDTTAAQNKADTVGDQAQANSKPITTAIPATQPMLDVVAENPAVILDPTLAAELDIPIKPVDLPSIDTGSPALWTTKFPFCLPFDIARLIGDFSAEAETPVLTFTLLPAHIFGLSNEEITFTIDFSEYEVIVRIFRFFIALAFVFFLIRVTRKIIS